MFFPPLTSHHTPSFHTSLLYSQSNLYFPPLICHHTLAFQVSPFYSQSNMYFLPLTCHHSLSFTSLFYSQCNMYSFTFQLSFLISFNAQSNMYFLSRFRSLSGLSTCARTPTRRRALPSVQCSRNSAHTASLTHAKISSPGCSPNL